MSLLTLPSLGAIILLEHRFLQPDNINALSKWIRAQCKKHTSGFDEAMLELEAFVKMRMQADDMEMDKYIAEAQIQEETVYVSGKLIDEQNALITSCEPEEPEPNETKLQQQDNHSQKFIINDMDTTSVSEVSDMSDEPPIPQPSYVNPPVAFAMEPTKKTRYNITCQQCRMQLGYCVEQENFVVQQKTVSSQYIESLRHPHPTSSPCYVYELFPQQDWNSSVFRDKQADTITVKWNLQDKICYQDIHCPTCEVSVPNGMGSSIIGARIVVCQAGIAKETTDLLGRIWLLYEAVKIGRSLDMLPDSPSKKSKYY
jgi:hypothetical protein